MVRIIIERHITPGAQRQVSELLRELRTRAMEQPGYISGETLAGHGSPLHQVVISTWRSAEHWERWRNAPERLELLFELDRFLVGLSRTTLFDVVATADRELAGV